ncbi:MAG: C-terminal target protein, partial [Bacteroidetes bacterium]|nr:C-terminal target protein [Bacteroidota bacterium]
MVALLFVAMLPSSEGYAQTRNVTFVVNTSTVPDTVSPTYIMQVRGSRPPLTWGNDTGGGLVNIGGDYWSKTLAFNVGDTLRFKFFAGTDGWESNLIPDPSALGGNDRAYIIANRDTVLPVQFFNNGAHGRPQYFRPWTTVPDTFINVYFRVNMQGAHQVSRFGYNDSLEADSVGVRGGGPTGSDLNWSPTFYLTKEQPAVNGGFSYAAKWFKSARLRIRKNAVTEGQSIDYKYLIGFDWGRDELQGQPNRNFRIPVGKKDTTVTWKWFDNIRPSGRINTDVVVVTYLTDLTKAITSGGFSIGDTIEVEQGHFGTVAGPLRVKRLARQGLSNFYQATDTVVTARNFVLDYQYYVNKNNVRTRENYYNFYYTGDVQAEAERRQVIVAATGPMTVRDTSVSIAQARRRPDFPNARRLLRNVLVKWEVDMRPAYYQILIGGDTLFDIQGTRSITTPGQVFQYGAWINGLATGGWQTWGSTLETDTTRKMWDDGTHGDRISNDSIYTRIILASPDSLNIGTKSQVGQVFKFGILGGDNE